MGNCTCPHDKVKSSVNIFYYSIGCKPRTMGLAHFVLLFSDPYFVAISIINSVPLQCFYTRFHPCRLSMNVTPQYYNISTLAWEAGR